MTISDGANLGPFRILGPLGRGGMASVYKAYEPGLDRSVAVKVLPAEYLHDPTFATRFRREAQVIAKLEHPHIIPIYAYGIDQGMPWMSMRLVSGGSLSSLLVSRGRLALARSLQVLGGVASALDYAHAAGVIHRDIKPQNILIDEHEHVYLADFGIAKMIESSTGLTATGMITGTPQYMAPEQALGSVLDHRADIYSLGVVAYECLTGRVPFTADTPLAVLMKHVREPIPLPPLAEVREPLTQVVLKALAKTPADRWPTAKAFVDGLHRAAETASLRAPTVAEIPTLVSRAPLAPPLPAAGRSRTPAPSPPRPSTSPAPWMAAGVLAATVLVAAAWMLWRMVRPAFEAYTSGPTAPATLATREAPVASPQTPLASPTASPTASASATASSSSVTPGTASPPPGAAPFATLPPVARPRVVPVVEAPESEPLTPAPPPPAPRAAPSTEPVVAATPVVVTTPAPLEKAPPSPEPSPPRAAVPQRPAGIPFALGYPIALGDATQPPVTLRSVTFKFVAKNAELQAEVKGYCLEGKDQAVDVQLELIDQNGATVSVLTGRGGIEEDNEGTVKAKQHLTQGIVASIKAFRLKFQTEPD